jgi:hypothetical protein
MSRRQLWEQVDGDLYALLGISPQATPEEVQLAWREVAKRTHPDRGGAIAEFQDAEIAYQVLSDPLERAAYDRSVVERGRARPRGPAGYSNVPPTFVWHARGEGFLESDEHGRAYPNPYDLPPAKFSGWMVALILLAVLVGVVAIVFFAAIAVVMLVIGGIAATIGSALRRSTNGR